MAGLRIDPVVIPGEDAELVAYPDDEIRLRAVGHGDIQVAHYSSTDRQGPPAHRHPWDEVQIVVDGYAEFRSGDDAWVGGGSDTVQLLPWVPHSVRIPEGEGRLIQVSIGPPYDAFARAMAVLFADGASFDRIAATAAEHGVTLG